MNSARNSAESVVTLRGVSKHYQTDAGEVPVLRNIDLEVRPGETTVLRGVSGSGKSTLLHIIGAVEQASSGSNRVCGIDLATLSPREQTGFRARNVGFVFQFFNLIPTLTALENVTAALEPLGGSRSTQRSTALHFLEAVGLADHCRKYPSQLSGGQQQRVAIARALVKRPPLIIADEPSGSLDAATAGQVLELLKALQRETGAASIIATHDPALSSYADRTYRLHNGALELVP